MRFVLLVVYLSFVSSLASAQDSSQPITAAEALKKIDQKVTVQMEVKSTGGNTARYLNSEADFKSEKNFAIFIPNVALPNFEKAGAGDPGKYYFGKTIQVTGTVSLAQNRPQIRVQEPDQIKVINQGAAPTTKPAGK